MDDFVDGVFAVIKTAKGEIIIKLEAEKAPLTVTNFAALAEGKMNGLDGRHFYDNLTFHRVIPNFMIQGGDPDGSGSGGPGYTFPDEFDSTLKHDRAGVLSMANRGADTNGSQFFITHNATPWLDGMHTVFGHVVSGQDVVNKIVTGDVIESITIERKGNAALNFVADQAHFDALKAKLIADAEKAKKNKQNADLEKVNSLLKELGDTQKTDSGIFYKITKTGGGSKPKSGSNVQVHYKLSLLDGKVVDESSMRGPLEFRAGAGEVIAAWDEMVLDMVVGEKRTVVIPPELGYGERGAGGVIPPNAFLVFDMELISFEN